MSTSAGIAQEGPTVQHTPINRFAIATDMQYADRNTRLTYSKTPPGEPSQIFHAPPEPDAQKATRAAVVPVRDAGGDTSGPGGSAFPPHFDVVLWKLVGIYPSPDTTSHPFSVRLDYRLARNTHLMYVHQTVLASLVYQVRFFEPSRFIIAA